MTTLARDRIRIPLTEGLFGFASSEPAKKISKLARNALDELASNWSYSPARHELFGLHLEANREKSGSFTIQTLKTANDFLTVLPKHLTPPDVSLDADGEVLFDWSPGRGRMMTLSLRHDGRLSFAVRFGAGRSVHGEDIFVTGTFPVWVSDYLEKLGV